MFRFGLFDKARTPTTTPAEKDGAIARTIAEQCAVLLKNQRQQLPLDGKAIHSIALIGPYAGAAHTGGGGSSAVTPIYTVTPMDGVKKHVSADAKLTYDDGHNPDSAVALAKTADVVLLMVGNKDREGRVRPDLFLPDKQDQLVSAVAAANPHTVVILKTGGPVLMPWLDQVAAVLEVWYPGEEDGNVVADLLFGNVNPSGKLSLTFPKAEMDTPAHTPQQYPGVNGVAIYSEGLQVGYGWYDSQKISPLFPFGYGLSYTSFALRSLKAATEIRAGDSLLVSVNLANTGSRAGAEVVQVYVAAPTEAGEPPRQIKAFTKVTVRPNQVQHITVKLDGRAFSIWDKSKNDGVLFPADMAYLSALRRGICSFRARCWFTARCCRTRNSKASLVSRIRQLLFFRVTKHWQRPQIDAVNFELIIVAESSSRPSIPRSSNTLRNFLLLRIAEPFSAVEMVHEGGF